ncbi:hypothetical protein N7462_003507 [Penicillium macrosclerotiorum]|uniref:uncharacterized protein n=1 Tax=Penicillium macrosclerotiorum TaxID=303699 RepID=UPI002546D0C2|nr:uncharacterized protein N7462_003507 [Penicillium macrosclerotiorum]KAJ5689115.1 hypothetical protein N7462_003507 [Penicillium macrosclerotiorum]
MWIRKNNPTTEHYYSSGGALPEISLPEMGERIRRIRLQGDRFWYPDNRSADREVDELLGPARLGGSEIHDQVRDLLATLNRRRMFPDVLDGASLCTTALSTEGSLEIFLFQVLLANALHMRMQRASDIAFGNLNNRVIAAMHASERWINGVDLKFPDPEEQSDYVEIRSLVHEQQAEGLVRFAELMAWPAIGEMRRLVEEAYPKILAGENCNRHLYDWLYGLMLPGNAFVFTIMAALVAATPSIQHLESAQYYMSGLILQDRSYWRVKSVLGRVLGGMKGVRAGNGWAGPFPRPVASSTEEIADGWWRVHARDVAFNRFMPRDQPADGGRFPPFLRREENSTKADWIRGINDRSEWVVPLGPRNLSDKVEFQAIKLRKIGLTSPEPTQASTTTLQNTNEQQQPEPEQRAVLELRINDKLVEFTLYSNPIFVAAPQCVDGPHAVQKQDYEKLQNVLSVSQLPGYVHNEKRVLIIDASGQGECELAARAWCSENGQHAVLARGHGTCLACAVKAASQGGLAIGCVICTGL